MVKLRWLQVNKFRSVKPGTRLTFNPGYNVLLGQNGTGKTTLLNLVAAAVKSDFGPFAELEFDLMYELASEDGTATIQVRNERRNPAFPEALDELSQAAMSAAAMPLDAGAHAPIFSAEVRFSFKTDAAPIVFRAEGSRLSMSAEENGLSVPQTSFDLPPGMSRALSLMVLYAMTIVGKWGPDNIARHFLFFSEIELVRFDESLEQFGRLRDFSAKIGRKNNNHYTLTRGPQEFEKPIRTRTQADWGAARYIIPQDELPFLQNTVDLLNFASAEAILELKSTREGMPPSTIELGNLKFLFTLPNGQKIVEKDLSYGQKRMLAFMYYLAAVKSVAIADELVNGLHHRWIRACIEALGQRQVFLTSQNPLLLDYLRFQSPEEVHSTFILCKWEDGHEQMSWENMSAEASADFFDSYKVGFQQVGELLQSKGLW